MNIGERGEILLKIMLTEKRDKHESFNGELIFSVGFDREYNSLPLSRISLGELKFHDSEQYEKIEKIAYEMNIDKASTRDKSDVYINKRGYSVKSYEGANSALINHTRRDGFERVCREIGVDIKPLDEMVEKYWQSRESGIIGEDISNADPRSPFKDHKEYFAPILEYFLFIGTGSGKSKHPADFILEYADPTDDKTWFVLNKDEAVNKVWPKLVFSMRSKKGMPPNYDFSYKGKDADSIRKWVHFMNDEYKGTLHVRINEGKGRLRKSPRITEYDK